MKKIADNLMRWELDSGEPTWALDMKYWRRTGWRRVARFCNEMTADGSREENKLAARNCGKNLVS